MINTLLILSLLSSPGVYNLAGLYKVFDARTTGERIVTFNFITLQGLVGSRDVQGFYKGTESHLNKGTDYLFSGDLLPGIGFSLNRYFEAGLGFRYSGDGVYSDDKITIQIDPGTGDTIDTRHHRNRISIGPGEILTSFKFSYPWKQFFSVGLITQFGFPVGPDTFKMELDKGQAGYLQYSGGYFRRFSPPAKSFTGILALSFTPTPNLGFHINLGRGGTGLRNTSPVNKFGVGLEINAKQTSIFIEDHRDWFTNKSDVQKYGEGWAVLTGGLRAGQTPGAQFNLYFFYVHQFPDSKKYPLIDENASIYPRFKPDFGVGLSLVSGLQFARKKAEKPPRVKPVVAVGSLGGTVTDGETGDPLEATIMLLKGINEYRTQSNPISGQYSFDSLPSGLYTLKVEVEGYKPFVTSVVITGETQVVKDILLEKEKKPEIPKGTFTGRVFDQRTEQPLKATISFVGSDIAPIETDSVTGIFRIDLPKGTYTIKVEAQGYIPIGKPIVIKPDEATIVDFGLLKKGMRLRFQNIYFETGKATIKPESYPILDKIVKILQDNPKVIVEIQGHTDASGSEKYNLILSQKRAEAVKKYLVEHGIEESRLIAKGYGESKPIAPNDTPENMAKNRRVEFVILGEKIE